MPIIDKGKEGVNEPLKDATTLKGRFYFNARILYLFMILMSLIVGTFGIVTVNRSTVLTCNYNATQNYIFKYSLSHEVNETTGLKGVLFGIGCIGVSIALMFWSGFFINAVEQENLLSTNLRKELQKIKDRINEDELK